MHRYIILILVLLTTVFTIVSCANIGSPDGGRYDEEPPKVLGASPAEKSVNVKSRRISILFDEFVKITDVSEKVVISPPQMEVANVRAAGKRIRVTLYDSLRANTTYTVDFSDAIEDNNEGNPMGFYTYSFSTGPTIDTMEMSGHVLAAENMEPVKSVLVGLHRADSAYHDSLFRTAPFLRVARTNASGHFSIKGIAPGRYRIFALNDMDNDYRFSQRAEALAFDTTVYVPSSRPDLRMDTCWRDSIYYDSIRVVPYTHYYPDDIVLRTFQEAGQDLHILKTERQEPDWFTIYFTAPVDTLPVIRGLNFDEKCLVLEASEKNDTLTYWITDTAFTHRTDTIEMEITYLDTDTMGQITWRTESIMKVARNGWQKIREEKQKKIDTWNKEREKRAKRSKKPLPPEKNPYETDFLSLRITPSGALAPNKNVLIQVNEPISAIDTARVHLYLHRDSNIYEEPFLLLPTPNDARSYTLYAEWKPEVKYTVGVDSMAIRGVMGHINKKSKTDLHVSSLSEFGTLVIQTITPDTGVVVQLLSESDKVVMEQRTSPSGEAAFYFLNPGEYYVRCYVDRNGNGKWDTGEYETGTEPERVFYFPKVMNVRAGWDVEQDWDLYGIPVMEQKPKSLIKTRDDKKKTARERNKEREEEKRQNRS